MTNNANELIILSPLDQDVSLTDEDHILDKITEMLLESIKEKNVRKALNIVSQLNNIIKSQVWDWLRLCISSKSIGKNLACMTIIPIQLLL